MTVHHERRVKRERNQQDVTNLVFIIKLLSQHVSGIIKHHGIYINARNPDYVYNPLLHTKSLRLSHLTGFSPLVTVQKTICGNTQSCSPEDGHNDARNMLG